MSSAARRAWIAAGSPQLGIMTPVVQLKAVLGRHGYEIGTVGNKPHMEASTPEDHTWYSVTGWPGPALLGWVYACDVMQPKAGSALPGHRELMEQISKDWAAKVPGTEWIKYMNRTTPAGRVIHEERDPGYSLRDSSDGGHGHISGRTDFRLSTTVGDSGYDPVARIRGGVTPAIPVVPVNGYPPFGGRTMQLRRPMMRGSDVLAAQRQFQARGWKITCDGWFGGKTADVVHRFQQDSTRHGWPLAADSELGPQTWRAMWLRPRT
jgi:hypothetical protein